MGSEDISNYMTADEVKELDDVAKTTSFEHDTSVQPELDGDSGLQDNDWAGRDWNTRFQSVCEALRSEPVHDAESRRYQQLNEELVHLSDDFIEAANTYGRIIISERHLRDKTIPPCSSFGGSAGGEKYLVNNILFKFALDFKGLYGGDHGAAKAAGQELKGLIAYYSCGVAELRVPLMALVDYMGFRLIAISVLPVNKETLVYGSADAGHTVHNSDPAFSRCMEQAAKRLNLAPHSAGVGEQMKLLSAACDVEGHVGSDDRFYLLDFSRTFPPVQPNRKIVNAHLYQLFRSEFVAAYQIPMCPDAFSGFIRGDPNRHIYNAQVTEATRILHEELPPFALSQDIGQTIWKAYTSSLNSDILNLSIPSLMHSWGLNIRLIGCLVDAAAFYPVEVSLALLIEALARALKNELRSRMREKMRELRVPLLAPYRQLIIDFFNQIFRPIEDSLEFWSEWILPTLATFFSLERFPLRPSSTPSPSPATPTVAPTPDETRSVLFSVSGPLGLMASSQPFRPPMSSTALQLSLEHILTWENPLGETSLRPRFVLFLRLSSLLGLTFSPFLENKIFRSTYQDLKTPQFEIQDLVSINVRVKHPTVVTNSAGMLWFGRGCNLLRKPGADSTDIRSTFARAKEKFQAALRSDPANKEALLNLAATSLKLLELDSKGGAAMATVDFSLSDPAVKEVQQYYIRAIKGDPRDPLTYYLYAKFLRRCNEWASAEECYLHAAEQDCNSVRIISGFGLFLMERDDPDGEALLRRAAYCRNWELTKEAGRTMSM